MTTSPRHAAPVASDDSSLFRWGQDLGLLAPAFDEERGRHAAAAEAAKETTVAASRRLAQLGETDVPASRALSSEVSAITAEAQRLQSEHEALAARWAALRDRAEVLPTLYRREHEVDEARREGERGGVHREMRADVRAAQQDT
jgi:hypothetical protein